jgi:glucose dehydrogenase
MNSSAKAVNHRGHASKRDYERAARTLLAISGALLSLVGAVLGLGGYLSPLGGSALYMFIGVALLVSGVLVARQHWACAWTYMAAFTGTLAWSLQNMSGGSSLRLRLVGPAVLLGVFALFMPILCRWRVRQAAFALVGILLATIAVGGASIVHAPAAAFTQFLDR